MAESKVIEEFLRDYIDTWIAKDIDRFMSFFSYDSVFVIGDGKDEICTTFEETKRLYMLAFDVDELHGTGLRILNTVVEGDIAWAALKAHRTVSKDDLNQNWEFRGSFVLKRTDREWKIRQLHVSVPMFGSEEPGWPNLQTLETKINQLVQELELNLRFGEKDKMEKIKKYLQKACELVQEEV